MRPVTPSTSTWERWTRWPLAAAALAFLAAYSWPILDPDLADGWRALCAAVVAVTWVAFIVDFAVRLLAAEHRFSWAWRHAFDAAVLLLPALRPLQLLLLVKVLNRSAASGLRGRVGLYVGFGSLIVAYVAALAALQAERGAQGASIEGFGDAMWWALTTMTTVGYGDTFPVTGAGRVVGALLMVTGVALLGVVTATLASWLVDLVSDEDQDREAREREHLRAELAALREQVALLVARSEDASGRPVERPRDSH